MSSLPPKSPDGPPPPPVVQRVRVCYAKRGRLRFTSHRDIQRAFERALRRAAVPMAYSAGFTPHPKISWAGAAPTGTASEAEYVELGLAERVQPDRLRAALDHALPPDLDILVVDESAGGSLADYLEASVWRIELPDVIRGSCRQPRSAALRRLPGRRWSRQVWRNPQPGIDYPTGPVCGPRVPSRHDFCVRRAPVRRRRPPADSRRCATSARGP